MKTTILVLATVGLATAGVGAEPLPGQLPPPNTNTIPAPPRFPPPPPARLPINAGAQVVAIAMNIEKNEVVVVRRDEPCIYDVKNIESGEILGTVDFTKPSKHNTVAPTYGGLTPNHIIWARVTIYGQFGAVCSRSGVCDDELTVDR